ncbi:MAG: phosphoribosyl-AMP cyclohydrolase [Pseudomonadota bacterium]
MPFAAASSNAKQQEAGTTFRPKFDANGLITAVAVDAGDGTLLMLAHMNAQALAETLRTGEVHYYSRSRKALWRKGETSGQIQKVQDMRVDCDQDAIILSVLVGGDRGACHTGARSCFYRRLTRDGALERVAD